MHLRRTTLLALSLLTLPLFAQQYAGGRNSDLDRKARLDWDTRPLLSQVQLSAARHDLLPAQRTAWNSFQQSAGNWTVLLDRRTGLVSNAMGAGIPTIPGAGNSLKMDTVRARLAGLGQAPALISKVGAEVDANGIRLGEMDLLTRDFFTQHVALFPGVNPSQMVMNDHRSGNFGDDGYLWFVDYDQVVNGVRVEGARITFRYNHGNLVQFGSDNWGMVRPDATAAAITPAQALDIAKDYLGSWDDRRDTVVSAPSLNLVAAISYARNSEGRDVMGSGYIGRTGHGRYTHKLTYDVTLRRAGQAGTWFVRVSALEGTVSEMRDINDYGVVKGGVYPGSASGKGTEIDIPMPFANYGSGVYADAAGNFTGTTGTTSLAGKYVKMVDSCGAISLAANASGVADLSLGTGTDCTTPGVGGAGNTHASRSGYWWVDQIKQKVRAFLPSNTWNNAQVTTNMNLNQTCNAYWNGSTLNFFKSGGGCGNTGELPDVFLHEFGHGLDQNDSTGTSSESGTGEAYGDSTALTMGHHSCTGPGFLGSNCSGYGDACTACTGVRELDYHKRASNTPWTAAKNASSCPAASCIGPMGKECHCESQPLTQGNWDIAQALITKYGAGAGWYKLDQLWYLTRNTAGQGFTKVTASTANGCGSANWLNTFLVVNDDDGNLANGTPDAAQIQAAYNLHGVGCSTMTSTSTVAGAALTTPVLTSTSTSTSVSLSWTNGGTNNKIFKNMLGCSYGFIQVASGASASYTDTAVSSAGTYYYAVQAVGAVASSISQFSNCIAVTPSGATTTWSVSGTVTDSTGAGISGVVVSSSAGSATTSATGAWTLSGVANGSYTFTPSKTSYTFTPANRAVTMASANVTGQNFTGATTATTYSIAGTAGTASATISYSGPSSSAVTAGTTATGPYTISNLTAGTYTLTPSKSGCTFSPVSQSVTVGPSATGKNFVATCGGTGVTALSNGVAVASSVNGAAANAAYKDFTIAIPSGASGLTIATTLASGDVDLYVKFGATPSLTVYDCRPYSGSGNESCPFATPSVGTYYVRVYNYATGNLTFSVTASFTTGTTTYSITGSTGTAGASATVSYGAGSVTASATGAYTISSRPAGTYTITPSKSGCTFSPTSLSVTVGPNATGKNFTATCGGGGTQVQRLSNAGFESGNNGVWAFSGTATSFGVGTTLANAHTGTMYGYLGNLVVSSNYTMTQSVSIPSTAAAGSVSFWLKVATNETTTTTAYDTLTAKITDVAGTTLCTLATYSNLNASASYAQKSFTLSAACITAINNKTVKLSFSGTGDASLGTTFRIDDASFMTN